MRTKCDCKSCCYNYCSGLKDVVLWVAIMIIGMSALYLIFIPGSNGYSLLLISNTYCNTWVWGICSARTYNDNHTLVEEIPIASGFIGFIMNIAVLGSMIIAIASPFLFSPDPTLRLKYVQTNMKYFALLVWTIGMIPIAIHFAPMFATHVFRTECLDYIDYAPFVIGNWFYSTADQRVNIGVCEKFVSLGYGNGVMHKPDLPGTRSGCLKCMNYGFWSVFGIGVGFAIVVYLIIVAIIKCNRYCHNRRIRKLYGVAVVNNTFE